jgi:UDP-N-acetyl-D-mannosaminuronate dehydrogenase
VVREARTANEAMPAYAVDLLVEAYGDLAGARVVVLGASYRGGVKEAALSGVFPTVAALVERGATPLVHDPMYDDDELRGLGFAPYHYGEPADAVVLQADHADYRKARADQFPGVKVLVDGRGVVDLDGWPGVTRRQIGVG